MAEMTRGEVRIAAPESAVFAVIADLDRYPEWTKGMGTPNVIERDPQGLPSVAEFFISAGPIQDVIRLAYTWEPGRVNWQLLSGSRIKALNGSYTWQSEGDGTRVVYELEADLVANFPGFLRKTAEKAIITDALDGLKRRVEQGA